MGKLFSGKVTTRDGETEEFENLTENEVLKKADISNPEVAWSRYREVLDTGDDN